jgi:hypothetical protein
LERRRQIRRRKYRRRRWKTVIGNGVEKEGKYNWRRRRRAKKSGDVERRS